jgi:hypothetical protein
MAVCKINNLNDSDLEQKKSIKDSKKQYSKLVDVLLIAFSICTLLVDLATGKRMLCRVIHLSPQPLLFFEGRWMGKKTLKML